MLTSLRRLGLEVKHLDSARAFYEERLGLAATETGTEAAGTEPSVASRVTYEIGASARAARSDDAGSGGDDEPPTLVLRRPTDRPRGGVHTHYAFSTTPAAYPRWLRRLADLDPVEFSFGSSDSLYVYDPAGHCVEIGNVDRSGSDSDRRANAERSSNVEDVGSGESDGADAPPLSGIFEVVLEVADLSAAERRYRRLGFEVVDRGDKRRRVRLAGPVDIELWEPQLGIADARGGLHVDLAFSTPNPDAAVEAGAPWPVGPEPVDGGLRVVDDDGHVLTFLASTGGR